MRILRLLALLLAALLVGLLIHQVVPASASSQSISARALRYAYRQMVWSSPPRVTRVVRVRINQLPGALAKAVSSRLRSDVNVDDLTARFGAGRAVYLAVVSGVFNSLPPDEGVLVRGDIVEIIDVETKRLLLLTQ